MSDIKEIKKFNADPDYLAQGLLNSEFVFDPGGENLKGGAYTLRSWRDDFYYWLDGVWVRLARAEIRRLVTDHILQLNDHVQDAEQQISVSTNKVNNVLLCLTGRIGVCERIKLNSWADGRENLVKTVAVKNGLLLLDRQDGVCLAKHTPDFFGLTKLPFDYDADAKCPDWLVFLDDIMPGRSDYVLLLQQWMGYLLRPDLREHKFLLCVGEGSNGKTVFFTVAEAMIGPENCSHVNLNQFHHPFVAYGTLGKIVNITNESSHLIAAEAENTLKTLVSGDSTDYPRKFREAVSARPTAKFMVATNALPRFNDKTMGIWRRILLVPFDKVIADAAQIKDLASQLKKELPGIFNWSLEGLKKLNKENGFTIPGDNKKLIEDYRKDSDPARAFLLDNYTVSLNGESMSCAEVFTAYRQYCEANNCRPMNNRTFGRQVKRIFPDTDRRQSGGRGCQVWTYRGLVNHVNQQNQSLSKQS